MLKIRNFKNILISAITLLCNLSFIASMNAMSPAPAAQSNAMDIIDARPQEQSPLSPFSPNDRPRGAAYWQARRAQQAAHPVVDDQQPMQAQPQGQETTPATAPHAERLLQEQTMRENTRPNRPKKAGPEKFGFLFPGDTEAYEQGLLAQKNLLAHASPAGPALGAAGGSSGGHRRQNSQDRALTAAERHLFCSRPQHRGTSPQRQALRHPATPTLAPQKHDLEARAQAAEKREALMRDVIGGETREAYMQRKNERLEAINHCPPGVPPLCYEIHMATSVFPRGYFVPGDMEKDVPENRKK